MAENNRHRPTPCRNLTLEFEEGSPEESLMKMSEDEQRHSAGLENQINEVLGTNLQSKIRKWNFDFINETPLEGDWDWEFEDEEGGLGRRNLPNAERPPGDDTSQNKFIRIR